MPYTVVMNINFRILWCCRNWSGSQEKERRAFLTTALFYPTSSQTPLITSPTAIQRPSRSLEVAAAKPEQPETDFGITWRRRLPGPRVSSSAGWCERCRGYARRWSAESDVIRRKTIDGWTASHGSTSRWSSTGCCWWSSPSAPSPSRSASSSTPRCLTTSSSDRRTTAPSAKYLLEPFHIRKCQTTSNSVSETT